MLNMTRYSLSTLVGLLALLGGAGRVDAEFIHTFNPKALATITDGDFSSGTPPRDGIPDTFDTVVLNAFYGVPPNDVENRAVLEFDIHTLTDLNSATLRLSSHSFGGDVSLSGYYGDGHITLDDWSRLDFFITTLTAPRTIDIDVLPFLQTAIESHQSYAGFAIWQAPSQASNGRTFESGELILSADRDFAVPPGIPEPASVVLVAIGAISLAPHYLRRRSSWRRCKPKEPYAPTGLAEANITQSKTT
jgi:hypothetical protein